MKKILFASLLAVAVMGFAQDGPKDGPKEGEKEGRRGGGPRHEMKGERRPPRPPMGGGRGMLNDLKEINAKIMAQYDKDQDGKLSEAEMAVVDAELNLEKIQEKMRMARAWNMFKKLDKDHDGKLSEEELKGMKDMRPAGRPGHGGPQRRREN